VGFDAPGGSAREDSDPAEKAYSYEPTVADYIHRRYFRARIAGPQGCGFGKAHGLPGAHEDETHAEATRCVLSGSE
jgi:hypothetical protein